MRSRLRRWTRFSLLVAVLPFASCAVGTYLGDRGRDLADCFTLTASVGPELSADAKLTELAHLAIGGGGHVEAGWIKGNWGSAPVVTLGLPVAPFIEDGVLYGRYVFVETGGAWDVDGVQDECYFVHFLPIGVTHPHRPWIDRFDLEVGVTVLVGARVGLSPGQFVDFLAGVVGFDPASDDSVVHHEPDREAGDQEASDEETADASN